MPITIQCPNPNCGATATVPETFSGRGVKCKKCGTPFVAHPTVNVQKSETRPAATGADPFPTLPAEFGRYRVLRLLGRGGMGSVYLAEDTQLGRHVALKLPAFAPGEAGQRAERFVREARSAAVLQHSNVCTVYDAGEVGGRAFISMAFVEGRELDDLIDPDAPMPERAAAELARKVALALAHAHAKGVVHRDLKPANVVVTPDGEPMVMDFGLAKRVAEADPNEMKLTRDGAVMGAPAYMPPEQVRGETDKIGPAVDVYALGVMLFEMLTGRTPYSGPFGVVMAQILAAPVPSAAQLRPGIDPRLADLCRRAMAKNPADRFPTMAAFADALAAYLDPMAVSVVAIPVALPPPPPPPPSRPVTAAPDFSEILELDDETTSSGASRPRSRAKSPAWKSWALWGAAAAALLIVAAGVWIGARAKRGDVVIELSDPKANVEVRVDGERVALAGLDRPLSLTVGDHGLTVAGPDFETVTQSFTVKRGANPAVKVTLKPKAGVRQPTPGAKGGPLPGADGWLSLFNGKDLTGWRSADGGATPIGWGVANGAIYHGPVNTAVAQGRDLWTRDRYGDFVLEVEYKTQGNSGIFIRADRPTDRFAEALEVQIDVPSGEPSRWSPGAIVGVAAPSREASKAGEWNTLRVTARGSRVEVTVNDQDVLNVDLDRWTEAGRNPDATANGHQAALRDLKREGHIGLQALDGNVSFRSIRLKPLTGQGAAAPGPPPADAARLGGSAFKAYSQTRSWTEAKALCEQFGGRLAVIRTDEQNRFVAAVVKGAGVTEAWIGAAYDPQAVRWRWIDGTALGYANWDSGEPTTAGGSHRAIVSLGRDTDNGKWRAQPERPSQCQPGFVCEWTTGG